MNFRTVTALVLVMTAASACSFAQMGTYPAGLGAGPAPILTPMSGPQFDRQYILTMYQQNSDIIGLTNLGATRVTSKNLRDLSNKIRREQMDKNAKLTTWAGNMGMGTPPVNNARLQAIQANLASYQGTGYDVQYAQTLMGLLQQSRDGANLALSRASMPDLRNQAQITVKASDNEIDALRSWLASPTK